MYNTNYYKNNSDNTARYVLGLDGINPLVVIGVNPSTADEKKPDSTIVRVMGYMQRNSFDGFLVINLYPERSTNPDNLSKEFNQQLHKQNLLYIEDVLSKYRNATILVAFGDLISKRSYLKGCFNDIIAIASKYNPTWKQIGDLTKRGNPRHPGRGSYLKLTDFDINHYIVRE
jgi:hypothetical protein